jgi:uroporphyrinogen decarboxylase
MSGTADPWRRFAQVALGDPAGDAPVALIVDSPWLPGHAGLDTLDYYLLPDRWLKANLEARDRFPEVAWLPGFWVEYGMAAEPSAFGAPVVWHHDRPPSIQPAPGGLAALAGVTPADPYEHGLMPLALQLYRHARQRLDAEGLAIRMVAARGPLAVASWLLGVTELLVALKQEPQAAHGLLDALTTTIIAWLRAQAEAAGSDEGILLLDDIPGMLSPRLFDQAAAPYLTRILDAFQGQIRVYHNDTPCPHLLDRIDRLPFEVWNFSHEIDIAEAQAAMPGKVLLGNVPPLQVMAQGSPDAVGEAGLACIRAAGNRNLILSAGGGVSPGTPPANIDALVAANRRRKHAGNLA